MAFAGQITLSSMTRQDILSGITTSGKFYRVRFHSASSISVLAASSNSATVGLTNLNGLTLEGWDGATSLYVYNPNGGSETISYAVTEIPSVGLSVTCS